MINQLDDPSEILAWLSERNKHIPIEELAYMLETHAFNPDSKSTNHVTKNRDKRTSDES